MRMLAVCGRNGRALLVAGLLAGLIGGLVAPDAVAALRGLVAPGIVGLLFLAVFRLGPAGVRAGLAGMRGALAALAVLQLVLPCLAALGVAALGLSGGTALAVVLVLAAAPVTGGPNLAILARGDPAPALRALVLGTLALPLTVLPVFALVPAFGDPQAVLGVVLRLVSVIGVAGGLALLARCWIPGTPDRIAAIDGAAALLLAGVVVALMGTAGPTLLTLSGWGLLALVAGLNLGLQLAAAMVARARGADPVPYGIVAGNRNLALFLSVLPADQVAAIMPFVGLYQIPMYLTPVVMPRLYRALARSPAASRQ
ncbi:MAG: hypothetical protein KDK01_16170 [Rhodobacteraceae bacterium]|nr:hypothetical protein [Paracoccaceae bacterium]